MAVPVFGAFLLLDLVFLGANLMKIVDGGWFPIIVAGIGIAVMATWQRGRVAMTAQRERDALPLSTFLQNLRPDRPSRIPGSAVYLTARTDVVPGALLHTLKHFNALHERVVLMSMRTEDVPRVPNNSRIDIQEVGQGFWAVQVRWGFMEAPSVARAVALCRQSGLAFDLMTTSFFVGRERLRPARRSAVGARWRQRLFILIANNALNATEFFGIPPNRAIEIGGHMEI
jgi:KUP system potassium uptake protein